MSLGLCMEHIQGRGERVSHLLFHSHPRHGSSVESSLTTKSQSLCPKILFTLFLLPRKTLQAFEVMYSRGSLPPSLSSNILPLALCPYLFRAPYILSCSRVTYLLGLLTLQTWKLLRIWVKWQLYFTFWIQRRTDTPTLQTSFKIRITNFWKSCD